MGRKYTITIMNHKFEFCGMQIHYAFSCDILLIWLVQRNWNTTWKCVVLGLTPQVQGSRPGWYGTFYWASDCWPPWQHERSLVCVEGRGRISWSGLTLDIKIGSCVFQCDVPHQWIAQRQVGPVPVYCDWVGCRVLCLQHGISVWQYIGQSTTATSRYHRDMTSDVSKRL